MNRFYDYKFISYLIFHPKIDKIKIAIYYHIFDSILQRTTQIIYRFYSELRVLIANIVTIVILIYQDQNHLQFL